MSALPPSHIRAMRAATENASPAVASATSLPTRWSALDVQAQQIAALAMISPEPQAINAAQFEAMIEQATSWQVELSTRAIADIEALTALGLRALGTLVERGLTTQVPALTLWREYFEAREAVLAAITPHQQAA